MGLPIRHQLHTWAACQETVTCGTYLGNKIILVISVVILDFYFLRVASLRGKSSLNGGGG